MELRDRPTGKPSSLRRQGDPQGGRVLLAGDQDVLEDEPRDTGI